MSSYGVALIAAFWAYDGWQGLSQVAGEIRDPQRNLPRASALGLLAVMGLYGLVHWSYARVLPLSAIQASGSVGVDAARAIGGTVGARALGAAILVSALGCLNGTVLTGARVTWAAAADGNFPRPLAYLHPRHRVPTVALALQFAWATVLIWSGRYDQLFTYVVGAAFAFYGLTAVALLRLRLLWPRAERPYRLPAAAWLAGIYLAGTAAFVANTFRERPGESLVGFGIVCLGWPAYRLARRGYVRVPAALASEGARVAPISGREAQETP
jgi:amino acid transporter